MVKVWKEDERACKREEKRRNGVKEGGRGGEIETKEQREREYGWTETERGREGGGGRERLIRERCYCSHLNSLTFFMNYSWATWTPVTSLPSKKMWENRERKEKILECSFLIVRQGGGGSCPHLIGWYKQWVWILNSQQRGEWDTPTFRDLLHCSTLRPIGFYPEASILSLKSFELRLAQFYLSVPEKRKSSQPVATEMHNRLDLFLVAASGNGLKTDKWHFSVYNLFCFLI